LIYTLKISQTTDLSEDGHFVFSLSDGSDWRYVNEPVLGFKNTDMVTAIALVAKF
jgi:hypothetical protein